jgi:hypothetical protein
MKCDEDRCLTVWDIVALTCMEQVLRCGITKNHLMDALSDPSSYRCAAYSEQPLGQTIYHPQELTFLLEATGGDATVLIRTSLYGEATIEFIENDLLGDPDYKGETLIGIDCKKIYDLIKANVTLVKSLTDSESNDVATAPSDENSL